MTAIERKIDVNRLPLQTRQALQKVKSADEVRYMADLCMTVWHKLCEVKKRQRPDG